MARRFHVRGVAVLWTTAKITQEFGARTLSTEALIQLESLRSGPLVSPGQHWARHRLGQLPGHWPVTRSNARAPPRSVAALTTAKIAPWIGVWFERDHRTAAQALVLPSLSGIGPRPAISDGVAVLDDLLGDLGELDVLVLGEPLKVGERLVLVDAKSAHEDTFSLADQGAV